MKRITIPLLCAATLAAQGATSITPANHYAYGANLGWMDWRGDTANGAVIGEYACSGYIYAANVGWIHLGDGTPADAIHYQNNSASDYGVNRDGLGNLRGYAYGANIGWVNFENTGAPKVDLLTGKFSGSVYSANCGWIGLSNAFAQVQTAFIQPGLDSDGDGIPDAWELTYTNSLTPFSATSDTDGDGMSDLAEELADTNPLDPNDLLKITAYAAVFFSGNETNSLRWTSKPSRLYQLNYRVNLNSGTPWLDATGVFAPDPGVETSRVLTFNPLLPERYFSVQAIKPLLP